MQIFCDVICLVQEVQLPSVQPIYVSVRKHVVAICKINSKGSGMHVIKSGLLGATKTAVGTCRTWQNLEQHYLSACGNLLM